MSLSSNNNTKRKVYGRDKMLKLYICHEEVPIYLKDFPHQYNNATNENWCKKPLPKFDINEMKQRNLPPRLRTYSNQSGDNKEDNTNRTHNSQSESKNKYSMNRIHNRHLSQSGVENKEKTFLDPTDFTENNNWKKIERNKHNNNANVPYSQNLYNTEHHWKKWTSNDNGVPINKSNYKNKNINRNLDWSRKREPRIKHRLDSYDNKTKTDYEEMWQDDFQTEMNTELQHVDNDPFDDFQLPESTMPKTPTDDVKPITPPSSEEYTAALIEQSKKQWFYKDLENNAQGPYPSEMMANWFATGYFNHATYIRRQCDERFFLLAEYRAMYRRIPFTDGSTIPQILLNTNINLIDPKDLIAGVDDVLVPVILARSTICTKILPPNSASPVVTQTPVVQPKMLQTQSQSTTISQQTNYEQEYQKQQLEEREKMLREKEEEIRRREEMLKELEKKKEKSEIVDKKSDISSFITQETKDIKQTLKNDEIDGKKKKKQKVEQEKPTIEQENPIEDSSNWICLDQNKQKKKNKNKNKTSEEPEISVPEPKPKENPINPIVTKVTSTPIVTPTVTEPQPKLTTWNLSSFIAPNLNPQPQQLSKPIPIKSFAEIQAEEAAEMEKERQHRILKAKEKAAVEPKINTFRDSIIKSQKSSQPAPLHPIVPKQKNDSKKLLPGKSIWDMASSDDDEAASEPKENLSVKMPLKNNSNNTLKHENVSENPVKQTSFTTSLSTNDQNNNNSSNSSNNENELYNWCCNKLSRYNNENTDIGVLVSLLIEIADDELPEYTSEFLENSEYITSFTKEFIKLRAAQKRKKSEEESEWKFIKSTSTNQQSQQNKGNNNNNKQNNNKKSNKKKKKNVIDITNKF